MALLRIIVAVLYCLCGYSAFVAFVILKNYASGVLGFTTGATHSILLYLHILEHRKKLQELYTSSDLFQIWRLGFSIFTIGTLCLVYHTVIEIMLKKDILPIADSSIISIVWSFMTMKSGLLLVYYSLKYEKSCDSQLLAVEECNEDDDSCSQAEE